MFRSVGKPTAAPIKDGTLDAAKLLVVNVIRQAVKDHREQAWRDDVDNFFSGPAFARYCVLLGWNHDIRQTQYES
jgi:hypothetical protein